METYSTSQIEVLTGISAHKLRIWERRYTFLKPMRTETNIRYYTPDQLTKLLNVSILTRNGYRISKIDKMQDNEINENVIDILINGTSEFQDEINALILHMMDYNEKEFNNIFQRSILRRGFLSTIMDIIYPFLNQIGILWGTNKIIISQEHFMSNLIRQKIITAIDMLPMPLDNAPSIALFLLDNEDHEIGLLLTYFIAKNLGWKVYYFGQRVPSDNIQSMAEKVQPDAMVTLIINPRSKSEISQIEQVFSTISHIPLLVSGGVFSKNIFEDCSQCVYIDGPQDLIKFLKSKPIK
ncbi:MAG: MerR family transcriptional regulator [Lutibacter sp.]|uniref:MerR family transcriptional regulator n=1 Tax=Lutibacter sp. TaxID=1925666 RepID=UPI00184C2AED|nr:MerR family transcriptional regulator [Lutibacter sp.]MBT8317281.1 MerR family transcriptional regulator [Lutibacter sp.]NNJ58140.1 MerR family transcriptional regulator [Lutibacter sp.]